MKKIKRIDPISFANMEAIVMAIFGFIVGILYSVGFNIFMSDVGIMSPFVAIIGFPIMYAIIGWISTAIFCLIYNLVASGIGGVKIELK